MLYSWSRPDSVDFPMTYTRFQALDCESDERLVEYRIEDLQESRFQDAVNIIRDKHLVDEPMKSSKGVRDCPISVQEMIDNLHNMLRQNISLVCYKDGSDEIVAVNILGVITETENELEVQVSIQSLHAMTHGIDFSFIFPPFLF